MKGLPGRKWSQTLKVWHLPDTKTYRDMFGLPIYFSSPEDFEKNEKIEQFVRWLRSKRYSESTIKTYTEVTVVFLNFFKDKVVSFITSEDMIFFNNEHILKNKLSSSYQNQFVNGIKLFFSIIENKKIDVQLILRPRVERRLPCVLSKQEVKAIINAPIT